MSLTARGRAEIPRYLSSLERTSGMPAAVLAAQPPGCAQLVARRRVRSRASTARLD